MVEKFHISGPLLIESKQFKDDRGLFYESFNNQLFHQNVGESITFVQDNISISNKNVLRGLHFQNPPYAQGKLVRVIKGKVIDVAVDIRRNSKTYGEYVKVELTAENGKSFWVPPGFAHGFLCLEDDTIFSYKCTNYYNKDSEGSIKWNDPNLNIDWGIENPILSEKDEIAPSFSTLVTKF